MIFSEELTWRGFVNQTTYKDLDVLDGQPITFYWGVDPSADSMTIGNLAAAMMVKAFIKRGHHPVLLIGGATGMIGDPDGKSEERTLKSTEELASNKDAIANQYRQIFSDHSFKLVDNYDWFKDMGFLDFLRGTGKHVPMRQMLSRDFIQTRLGEGGSGISYAEFSYVLIQAYDFLHLYKEHNVTLQVCGSDQWGNSIAGVELIRRMEGGEANVFSVPLIVNKSTGQKFGKSEEDAIWLDAAKTSPTKFYQFWINVDDESVESYLKVFTELSKEDIEKTMEEHKKDPARRIAQTVLAKQTTELVHGKSEMQLAETVTEYLIGKKAISGIDASAMAELKKNIPSARSKPNGSMVEVLVVSGLATSNTEARRLISGSAISINNKKVARDNFESADFNDGYLIIRRGKAFKDSALVELEQ